MRFAAGVDVGSTQTKAVVIEEEAGIVARALVDTGANVTRAAESAFNLACGQAGTDPHDVGFVVGTGYGRYRISFGNAQMTEISCHARGAHYIFPTTRTVIDMGGQDSKAISVGAEGEVLDFVMNDKCAAGTGSFIVRAAKYLQIDLKDVGELALKSTNPQPISSICAVLAESEIINHVSAGVSVEDILRGIYDSLADRAAMLLKRAGLSGELTFIGGVANQRDVVKALEDRLKVKVYVPVHCEYVCALGAALLGLRRLGAARSPRNTDRLLPRQTASLQECN